MDAADIILHSSPHTVGHLSRELSTVGIVPCYREEECSDGMATMPFSVEERSQLLQVKGVGPKVIERLEQLGIDTFPKLAQQDAVAVCSAAAATVGSSCWKNSPQAKKAIEAAIALALSAR